MPATEEDDLDKSKWGVEPLEENVGDEASMIVVDSPLPMDDDDDTALERRLGGSSIRGKSLNDEEGEEAPSSEL